MKNLGTINDDKSILTKEYGDSTYAPASLTDTVGDVSEALGTHENDKDNPHGVTKDQLGLDNVENKSSATIRGELTQSDVTTALGYTPPTSDTTYSNFVKSGSGAESGLVPAPPTTEGTTKYLREDGTWQEPSAVASVTGTTLML